LRIGRAVIKGLMAPSCRAPQGHDQTREIYFFPTFSPKIRVAASATRPKAELRQGVACGRLRQWQLSIYAELRLPQLEFYYRLP